MPDFIIQNFRSYIIGGSTNCSLLFFLDQHLGQLEHDLVLGLGIDLFLKCDFLFKGRVNEKLGLLELAEE